MQSVREWLSDWVKRVLPNSQAVSFAILLIVGFVLVISLGQMLMPVFAAGVIAYLLEGLVAIGVRKKLPRLAAVIIVYVLFLAFLLFLFVALLPLLYQQTVQLIEQLPAWMNRGQMLVMQLPQQYPNFITEEQIYELTGVVRRELLAWGQSMLTYSYASLVSAITLIVYLILVPLLVFFFLKDKDYILGWFSQYMPRDRNLSTRVWREVDMQIGNYVRGKFFEVTVLLAVSYAVFSLMGLNYSLLLAVLMGLSVIIPYVGATLVTFPVMIVAFFQWGLTDDFWYLLLAYGIIQALDGVVLVPLLFSEVVNLHPVAIIVAILFFGGFWGFWGVFFAIPLATLVKAVLAAWPRLGEEEIPPEDAAPAQLVKPPKTIPLSREQV
ncbi:MULTISPECIES: AI-2E family transporter [Methylocaldum]|jgi:putative permease|uniref:AI-2E family transporter n=1 Tax=unclassified Methylocaldum TaxID=2622260 RepID=UPI00098BCDD3|nr:MULTISPECIES: AI-2E family transporter [unclassified Methylocaldum]MBP1149116.1 putative permease [Methylocaldum sp. RMAD-M]MDV3240768.1 AI-2E family transporter [Methylocaldum sp.]MVF20307.1 AI-2E family transporter [Methylocaldum sp. BRCS4]